MEMLQVSFKKQLFGRINTKVLFLMTLISLTCFVSHAQRGC